MVYRLFGRTVNQLTGQSTGRFLRIAWLVGKKCWYVQPSMAGAKDWNALPEDIRCEKSIRTFETQLESIDPSASTTLFLNDFFFLFCMYKLNTFIISNILI